jgi:hypothetical protein
LLDLADALAAAGLLLRGGFHPLPADGVPALAAGAPVGTLLLIGNAGSGLWRAVGAALTEDGAANPLDRYVERVIGDLARRVEAQALFPFHGPPYLPFQRWAQRAEAVAPSPIGLLIHPDYGLWHAYRGAVAFAARLDLPPRVPRPSPCATCTAKPCLSTCPVDAFKPAGYDVPVCVGHVESPAGADCRGEGCRARRACPVGADYRYVPAHAAFHMRAFLRARRRD